MTRASGIVHMKKQQLRYWGDAQIYAEMAQEATRLGRPTAWVIETLWRLHGEQIRRLSSIDEELRKAPVRTGAA